MKDGTISGIRASSLFTDAADAETQGVEELTGISLDGNALRNLQRKLTKKAASIHLKHLPTDNTFLDTVFLL